MTVPAKALIVGLTGAFGSGCTTMAETLAETLHFENIKISDLITEQWRHDNQDPDVDPQLPLARPPRGSLQDVGDSFRRFKRSHWVEHAIDVLDQRTEEYDRVVLDGIRNPAESDWLRRQFKDFFLVAVDAKPDVRWRRLEDTEVWRGRSRAEFEVVSARDAAAPEEWGQQVQQCIDQADYLITNDDDLEDARLRQRFISKAADLIELSLGADRRPSDDEFFMHLAYTASLRSACLKRNVGAVLAQPGAERQKSSRERLRSTSTIVSVGFNENPDWMDPCFLRYNACYKDLWMKEQTLALSPKHCPRCGALLRTESWPPRCSRKECATTVLEVFFPERGMTHCTAIHGEVRAIRAAAATSLAGARLYTTTFPCFLCAEEIIQAGIEEVVYVEAYPSPKAERLLEQTNVALVRFEGVKSQAFDRFFRPWRMRNEGKYPVPPSMRSTTTS